MKSRLLLGAALFTAVFFFSTCEEETNPVYAGKWECIQKEYLGDFTFNITRTLILSKSGFEDIEIWKLDNSSDISSIRATKGTMAVNDDEITFTITEVGICVKNASNKCTDQIQYFPKGHTEFTNYVNAYAEIYTGEFEADEDYLYIQRDLNDDDDYDDMSEELDYDRK